MQIFQWIRRVTDGKGEGKIMTEREQNTERERERHLFWQMDKERLFQLLCYCAHESFYWFPDLYSIWINVAYFYWSWTSKLYGRHYWFLHWTIYKRLPNAYIKFSTTVFNWFSELCSHSALAFDLTLLLLIPTPTDFKKAIIDSSTGYLRKASLFLPNIFHVSLHEINCYFYSFLHL